MSQNGRVSPRTSSQSEKQSSSPVHPTILAAKEARVASSPVTSLGRQSPQSLNADSHAAKMARMEAAASQGFGGGIPAKIEEGVELQMGEGAAPRT